MGFAEDFTELLTNPALIAGAAGALAPEEVNIGGTWWRVAPRLKALSGVLGAARQGAEDTSAGKELAGLAQPLGQGQGPLPWPPGQTPAPPEGAQAAPATTRALPPGMVRAGMMSKVSPDLYRHLGRSRGTAVGLDAVLGAGEAQAKDYETAAKKKAIYDAYLAGLSKTHPPEVAESMARAAAEMQEKPSEPFMSTPLEARAAQTETAQVQLEKIQQQRAFTAEVSKLDPNDYEKMKMFRDYARVKYPQVPFTTAFGDNAVAHLDFERKELAAMNAEALKNGQVYYPEVGPDGHVKIGIHEFKGGPADVQAMAQGTQAALKTMVDAKLLPPQIAASFNVIMEGAVRSANPNQFIQLIQEPMALLRTYIHADMTRRQNLDVLKMSDWNASMAQINKIIETLDKDLRNNPNYAQFMNGANPAHQLKTPQGEIARKDYLAIKQRMKIWMTIQTEAGITKTPEQLQSLIARGREEELTVQGGVEELLSKPPGK